MATWPGCWAERKNTWATWASLLDGTKKYLGYVARLLGGTKKYPGHVGQASGQNEKMPWLRGQAFWTERKSGQKAFLLELQPLKMILTSVCRTMSANFLQLSLPIPHTRKPTQFFELVRNFSDFGETSRQIVTEAQTFDGKVVCLPTFVNEFWTAKQRAAHSLHEISYRACFKPQLPRFFIERLTAPGDRVYDPFMGRGTTLLEAALLGRVPVGCDVNPLSAILVEPRFTPPTLANIEARLKQIDFTDSDEWPEELLVFYHPDTLKQIVALKKYLLRRQADGTLDVLDKWIRMTAINRLTGHSPGFFSVYTLPPNQAVSVKAQIKINKDRNQTPTPKDVAKLILKKSKQLLADCTAEHIVALKSISKKALLLTQTCDRTLQIPANSIALAVTSPPFLDVVDYAGDNWLRCWFAGIDAKTIKITVPKKLEAWQAAMTDVFRELHRILKPGGYVAFEVGEVRGGKIKLEQAVVPCAMAAGLTPELILINDQVFTKTANCWGVDNNAKGTNTNRIVLLRKDS